MLLIVAGRTAPNRAVVFGGEHDDLDDRGRRDVALIPGRRPELSRLPGRSVLRVGPEPSVRQSAELVTALPAGRPGSGVPAGLAVDPRLATLDIGSWRGLTPEQIPAHDLGAWFADPAATPHGGESVSGFVERIVAHVSTLDPSVTLVVAKAVAQALLCPRPEEYFATEVKPASLHRL
ncbi:phosphoglycerate mutase family protein [Gordonia hirsuta DSM 44140 = NBRC 16056]|uniref:Phosphoglycerate mutase family protein n=1 Tax=Gordonia hirsuta DSM 44140 = NBRC 16056 TaxID=1121927 RepID=L7L6C9_9ACTN|nr:histidine phosphatase family protein [Gordonia hirsuta]GAC56710.1 phosphoglycerate mutase family protein [Gordonia hirsuta DSM 44140 = NBRC 16056]